VTNGRVFDGSRTGHVVVEVLVGGDTILTALLPGRVPRLRVDGGDRHLFLFGFGVRLRVTGGITVVTWRGFLRFFLAIVPGDLRLFSRGP